MSDELENEDCVSRAEIYRIIERVVVGLRGERAYDGAMIGLQRVKYEIQSLASLRARPQEPGDLISREAAIEALEAEVADSDKQWERLVDGRFGGSEREAGRGGGLRRAVDVIGSLSAPQEPGLSKEWLDELIRTKVNTRTTGASWGAQALAEAILESRRAPSGPLSDEPRENVEHARDVYLARADHYRSIIERIKDLVTHPPLRVTDLRVILRDVDGAAPVLGGDR